MFQFAGAASFADFQQGIGRAQAEHLAATGHRRLGYALPDDERLSAFADPRLAGVRAACADLGLAEPVAHTVPLDRPGASAAVRAWRRSRITAVCAYNDEVALAVLAGIRGPAPERSRRPRRSRGRRHSRRRPGRPALTTIATGMSTLGSHLAAAVVAGTGRRTDPAGAWTGDHPARPPRQRLIVGRIGPSSRTWYRAGLTATDITVRHDG